MRSKEILIGQRKRGGVLDSPETRIHDACGRLYGERKICSNSTKEGEKKELGGLMNELCRKYSLLEQVLRANLSKRGASHHRGEWKVEKHSDSSPQKLRE